MNDNDNLELYSELAKSIEKLVDEETTVAKAFVDRNSSKDSAFNNTVDQLKYNNDKSKTQAIPDIPSRKVALENGKDDDLNNNNSDDLKNVTNTSNGDLGSPNKKKLDKKTKLIIAGVSAILILVIAAIIIISVIINNKNKSTYDYNYSKGVEYYNEKDYKSALPYFEKAENTDKGKKNVELKFKLYDSYLAVGENDKAIEKLKDILSYEKNNEKALTTLAGNYSTNKQGDKLTELIRKYEGVDGQKYLTSYMVSEPVASQAEGKYEVAVDLEFQSDDSNAIYYTLDGTEPTSKSLLYSEAIHIVKGETTVKVIAVNSIGTASNIVEMKFSIDYKAPDAPDVSPASNTASSSYEEGQIITINNLKEGDTAYYTIDGSTPTKASKEYTEEFIMPTGNNIVVSVIIYNQYDLPSSVTKRNYNVVVAKSYSYEEAKALLIARMKVKGDLKSNGTTPDSKKIEFTYDKKRTIDNVEMYIVFYDIGSTRQSDYYGVAVKSGKCYKVTESGGIYTATEY